MTWSPQTSVLRFLYISSPFGKKVMWSEQYNDMIRDEETGRKEKSWKRFVWLIFNWNVDPPPNISFLTPNSLRWQWGDWGSLPSNSASDSVFTSPLLWLILSYVTAILDIPFYNYVKQDLVHSRNLKTVCVWNMSSLYNLSSRTCKRTCLWLWRW